MVFSSLSPHFKATHRAQDAPVYVQVDYTLYNQDRNSSPFLPPKRESRNGKLNERKTKQYNICYPTEKSTQRDRVTGRLRRRRLMLLLHKVQPRHLQRLLQHLLLGQLTAAGGRKVVRIRRLQQLMVERGDWC